MSVDKSVDLASTSKKGGAEMRQLQHLKCYLAHKVEDRGDSGPPKPHLDLAGGGQKKSAPDLLTLLKLCVRAMLRVERGTTLQHQLGLGVDEDGAVHVDVQLEALAGVLDVVRLELRHHLGAGERKGRVGARAGRLDQVDRDV